MALMAITNGYFCSKCFYYGPQLVTSNSLKGKAALSTSFFLIAGIFAGTLFANFISKNLI